jgi:uncharacterized RDD family membrane protein YckC
MADEPMSAPESPPPAPAGAWEKPAEPKPGTAGFVYADVPNRIIALIIDVIVLAIVGLVVGAILTAIVGPVYKIDLDFQNANVGVETNYIALILNLAATMAVSAVYWIYCWTKLRGSVGQKVLGMQVGNYPDGKTLTQDQAIRRWIALGGVFPIAQALNGFPALGTLISLAIFAYTIYLLYSTAKSPTKQGFHDTFANSVVVKASRMV